MFLRLLLVRLKFGLGILISVYGFANNILNKFGRVSILLHILVIFSHSKSINCQLLQILVALLTKDLIRSILYSAGAKLPHLL